MNVAAIRLCRILLSLPTPKGRRYLPRTMRQATLALTAAVMVAGCRPSTVSAPTPVTTAKGRPAIAPLPPIPLVEGPLAPRIVYPQSNQLIQSKDSTFILGSVGNGRATLTINGLPVQVKPNGAFLAFVPNPPPTATPQYEVVATLGPDTVRVTQPVRVAGMPMPYPPDSTKPPPAPPPPNVVTDTTPTWVILGDSVNVQTDTDRVVIGRPEPNETYRWFLLPGTRAQLTARYPGYARVRLDSSLQIWVQAADAKTFATDTSPPHRVAGNSSVRAGGARDSAGDSEYSDLVIPINERPPYFVEERERALELTLYGTRGNTDLVNYPTSDSLIKHVEWSQELGDRVRYTVRLSQEPYGFLVLYENNAFVLRVRRRPVGESANASRVPLPASRSPLSGLTIAIDPGHPPAGATGPTGFYEGDAVLPVAFFIKGMLESRGANVVMTRMTRDVVDLAMRSIIARRANAHAFVSLHYNAYGDGTNPLVQINGIETFFYRPHAEALARDVQTALLTQQPLEDEGVHYRSLAIVRTTWMPSVLVEGGYIIIPEQENAMKTEQFQERYARGVVEGLEAYFRALRAP
jgi:N-acetylmuramoyl-L-alanine amidase